MKKFIRFLSEIQIHPIETDKQQHSKSSYIELFKSIGKPSDIFILN